MDYRIIRRARTYVQDAIMNGKLIRPEHCEICERKSQHIEAHHCDYRQPLDVQWLCRNCHVLYHRIHGKKRLYDLPRATKAILGLDPDQPKLAIFKISVEKGKNAVGLCD